MQQAHAAGLQAAGVSGGREVAGSGGAAAQEKCGRQRHKKNADDRIRGRAIIPVFLSKNWKLLELNFFFTFT